MLTTDLLITLTHSPSRTKGLFRTVRGAEADLVPCKNPEVVARSWLERRDLSARFFAVVLRRDRRHLLPRFLPNLSSFQQILDHRFPAVEFWTLPAHVQAGQRSVVH